MLNFTLFSENLDYALGWMVIHSLWQATLIALISGVLMIVLRKKSAHLRYIIAHVALWAVFVSAISTFCFHYDFNPDQLEIITEQTVIEPQNVFAAASPTQLTEGVDVKMNLSSNGLNWADFKEYFNKHLPLILTIWLMGVALFLLRLLGSVSYIYYLKNRMNFPADEYWMEMSERLSEKVGLSKMVDLVESALVRSPVVVGHLKPMILFPIGVLNRLDTHEVEAILAHELAHILRHDYIFNILQSIVEALFYYHPAVWWLSNQVRNERENACDDIAINLINSKMNYAKALVTIQEMAFFSLNPALGFAGQRKNQFMLRMQRILNMPQNKTNVMEKLIATLLIVCALFGLTIAQNNNKTEEKVQNTVQNPTVSEAPNPQSTPEAFQNITTIGDTSGKPFYTVLPPTPEIIKLQAELAELEKAYPQFEKEQEAEIEKLKQELAEMEGDVSDFEKKKEAEIAAIEKEVSSKKGNLTSDDKKSEAKIEAINKEIKAKEASLELFTKKVEAENKQLEAQIAEKKKERDGKKTTKHSSVDGEIQSLYGEMQSNLGEIQSKRGEIQGMYGEIQGIRGEMSGNRGELQGKYGEIQGLRGEMMGRRGEIQGKRGEIQGKMGEMMGKKGEIMGKRGEIQGKYSELVYKSLVADLKSDNIITDDKKLTVKMTEKDMFVNDIKQSDALHAKYKAKYMNGNNRGFEIIKRNGNLMIHTDDDDN